MEVEQGIDSPIRKRWENYVIEVMAIEKKLSNSVPKNKKEKLKFRLKDLEDRLMPELVNRMNYF